MRFAKAVFTAILALLIHTEAFSLEQAASVQVSTVLKAENSWDGKPIGYPQGKPEITGMLIEIAPRWRNRLAFTSCAIVWHGA